MNPFECYVREVGRFLPGKVRKDITSELLSDLYAELDMRRVNGPGEEDDLLMRKIVAERGAPQTLAAAFDNRVTSLVGPNVYPTYKVALYVALATSIITVVAVTFGLWSITRSGVWDVLADVTIVVVIVFAVITSAFAVSERLGIVINVPPIPRTLDATRENGASLYPIIFAIFILALNNAFPGYIGLPLVVRQDSLHLRIFPVLGDHFFGLTRTLINIWCVVTIGVNSLNVLSRKLRYNKWVSLGLRAFGLAVGVYILSVGNIFAIPPDTSVLGMPKDLMNAMAHVIAPSLFKVLLVVFWFGLCIRAFYLIRDSLRWSSQSAL